MLKYFFVILFSIQAFGLRAAEEMPSHMQFCGMDLTITQEAQEYIGEVIAKLKRSDQYFQLLITRANIYMPYVEEAFASVGVPDDLKYIVLQESALQGDAVSSSNAVGFWQFKDFTGKEVGLTINDQVDERKHIFMSSVGAARYFHRLHRYFGNWIYAVVAYNRGASGSLPYAQTDLFSRDRMIIDKKIHWYALKALAHKIAFEHELGKNRPQYLLLPGQTLEVASMATLAQRHGINYELFKSYNLWISQHVIPGDKSYVYYIPVVPNDETTVETEVMEPQPVPFIEAAKVSQPEMITTDITIPAEIYMNHTVLQQKSDPDYGVEYVFVRDKEIILEIALAYDINWIKLHEWNAISRYDNVAFGTFIRLKPAKKARIHIVTDEKETIHSIGLLYGIDSYKLQKLNRLSVNERLWPGRKILLKSYLKKETKPEYIIRQKQYIPELPAPKLQKHEEPPEISRSHVEPVMQYPNHSQFINRSELKLPEVTTEWVWHTVGPKESIWTIAKNYDWPSSLIKAANHLTSDQLKPGQKIKILQSIPK